MMLGKVIAKGFVLELGSVAWDGVIAFPVCIDQPRIRQSAPVAKRNFSDESTAIPFNVHVLAGYI
jgi:hypothetical protein